MAQTKELLAADDGGGSELRSKIELTYFNDLGSLANS